VNRLRISKQCGVLGTMGAAYRAGCVHARDQCSLELSVCCGGGGSARDGDPARATVDPAFDRPVRGGALSLDGLELVVKVTRLVLLKELFKPEALSRNVAFASTGQFVGPALSGVVFASPCLNLEFCFWLFCWCCMA
jgi:hypothetical protein